MAKITIDEAYDRYADPLDRMFTGVGMTDWTRERLARKLVTRAREDGCIITMPSPTRRKRKRKR